MAAPLLRAVLNPRSGGFAAVKALCDAAGNGLSVVDSSGKLLLGDAAVGNSAARPARPIDLEGSILGSVIGDSPQSAALVLLLQHLVARESEQRALASETLHLYREINLIEQLSEQLAAILNLQSISDSALAQARRLIPATHPGPVPLYRQLSGQFGLGFPHGYQERRRVAVASDAFSDGSNPTSLAIIPHGNHSVESVTP